MTKFWTGPNSNHLETTKQMKTEILFLGRVQNIGDDKTNVT